MNRLGFWSIVSLVCGALHGGTIVVPISLSGTEGAGALQFSGARIQQLYDHAQFGSGPTTIVAISFRPDSALGSAFTQSIASFLMFMSTTSQAAGSLSSTYANNIGLNPLVVYNGALNVSSSFTGPVSGPKAFDIIITLQTPYLYDPAQGNLLVDFQTPDFVFSSFLDATPVTAGVIDRVSGTILGTVGFNNAGTALVTQFSTVPEPGTTSLLLAGLAGLGWKRWRCKKASRLHLH